MSDSKTGRFKITLGDRGLSVVVFSLCFAWILVFPFEGQILYSLAEKFDFSPDTMVFGAIAAQFVGLFGTGFFIRTATAAKKLMLGSTVFCFFATCVFFFPPSFLWTAALLAGSLFSGGSVASWGFFLKSGTPKNERIKTTADGLIYSNILMILLNMAAVHLSPYAGLGLAALVLALAFFFTLQLSPHDEDVPCQSGSAGGPAAILRPLAFLCLFVVIITIDSGLMYQVLNPAFAHLQWLTSWYWAVPYIIALYIMRNLPRKTNRTYILYVAIAMIGFSFIAFMSLDRSASSYLVVNTLMLGACGVYDLFWWSILGEMLDYDKNAAKILGIGLSANVMGVLLGGLVGNAITSTDAQSANPALVALAVVCVTLVILPPLNRHLGILLKNHAYLTAFSEMSAVEQDRVSDRFIQYASQLTDRERQVAGLLLRGKTYRMIAGELFISENTVKYYVKNIYAKLGIRSRTELVNLLLDAQPPL